MVLVAQSEWAYREAIRISKGNTWQILPAGVVPVLQLLSEYEASYHPYVWSHLGNSGK